MKYILILLVVFMCGCMEKELVIPVDVSWVDCSICGNQYMKDVDEPQHGVDKWCDGEGLYAYSDTYIDTSISEPATTLCFEHEGRTATIDFGGDEITYEGDMPVAESAKIFFEAVWGIYKTGRAK